MTFLPIIERELRVRARSRSTYWTRFAVALVGMLICLPQLVVPGSFGTAASIGKGVFNGIVGVGFVLSCCACLLTADAVSSERREGTLGLLFLTRVSRFDVLLGKLGSVALTSFCVLVVLLPMLMIPVLAGGVTAGDALRKGLALLNLLFFALAAGLFASTLRKERSSAASWALGIVALAVIAPLVLEVTAGSPWAPPVVALLSPLFVVIWDKLFSTWLVSLLIVQAMAWLLLVRAGAGLRRAMREEGGTEAALAPFRGVDALARRRWQPFEGATSTVEWLVRRQRGINVAIWTATSVGILYQLASFWFYRFAGGPGMMGYVMVMLPGLAVSLFDDALLAWAASRFFVEARQTGELELLLTTPMGTGALISGQWNALKRLLCWPVMVMAAVIILRMFLYTAVWPRWRTGSWVFYGLVQTPLALGHLFLGIAALCWTAVWFGLKARRQTGAVAWTVGLARGVPFLISTLGQSVPLILMGFIGLRTRFLYPTLSLVTETAILLFYLWLIRWAKRCLMKRLGGAEPMSVGLWQPAVAAIRRARRWTPA